MLLIQGSSRTHARFFLSLQLPKVALRCALHLGRPPLLTRCIRAGNVWWDLLKMLVKLKHGLKFQYLPDQIAIPESTLNDLFSKWLDIKLHFLIKWPDTSYLESFPQPSRCSSPDSQVSLTALKHSLTHPVIWRHVHRRPCGAINFLSRAWGTS